MARHHIFSLFAWACAQDIFLEHTTVLDPSTDDEGFTKPVNSTKPMQDLRCIRNTGGTCSFLTSCADWRGRTKCRDRRCLCKKGTCSRVDGVCVKGNNTEIHKSFRLRNARFSNYHMYISTWTLQDKGLLYVSKKMNGQSDWNLYQPPTARLHNRPREFFLSSSKYENMVVKFRRYDVLAQPLQAKRGAGIGGLALQLFAPPDHYGEPNGTQSVMIESYMYPGRFLDVDVGSWAVSQQRGDPGAGGYWIIEPPIEGISFRRYDGPRCSFDCGSYGSGASTYRWVKAIGTSAILCCILCCCSCALYIAKCIVTDDNFRKLFKVVFGFFVVSLSLYMIRDWWS